MKFSFRLFTALAALGGASTLLLGHQSANSQTSPQVVASYSVLCDLTQQIAQDTVDVTCLIEAGEDPHLYSATPSDRRAIETADLVLYGGYGFEPDIIQMVESTDGDTPQIAVSEVAVTDPLLGEAHDHGSHGDHHDEHDDHGHDEHDEHGEEGHDEHDEHDHEEHDHEEHSSHSKAGHEGHDHGEHGHDDEHDEKEDHDDHCEEDHDDHDDHGEEDHADHHDHGEEDHDDHGEEDHHDHGHEEHSSHSKAGHEGHDEHGHEDHGEEEHDDHCEEEGVPDPHVWHDAENGIAMVRVIQAELSEAFPENAVLYQANAAALIAQLTQLDSWIQQQVATVPASQRVLVTTHDALGYYADAYGIRIEAALESFSTEARPSAADLRDLIDLVDDSNIPNVFIESTSNPGLIEAVSRETDIGISEQPLYADSLGEAGTPAGTYAGMLMTNTCTIVNGLGGICNGTAAQAFLD